MKHNDKPTYTSGKVAKGTSYFHLQLAMLPSSYANISRRVVCPLCFWVLRLFKMAR